MERELLSLQELQNRIGYAFNNPDTLDTAVTHSSYAKECHHVKESNERLEFLGDAFFDAIIGEELFRLFPSKEEGFLSQVRAALVCEDALAREAVKIDLGQFLKLGKGEEKSGGRSRKSILADALEAVIGAVYIDGGFEAAKDVVLRLFAEDVREAEMGTLETGDFKTSLQEMLQKSGSVDIRYFVIEEQGPDHDKTFTVELVIDGMKLTRGTGKSKKKAEQQAAKNMIDMMEKM